MGGWKEGGDRKERKRGERERGRETGTEEGETESVVEKKRINFVKIVRQILRIHCEQWKCSLI